MRAGRGRTKRGQSDEFGTPRDIISELERLNGAKYAVDLAATEANSVAPTYLFKQSVEADWVVLITESGGPAWCNPPFSKPNLPAFTAKALEAAPRLRHRLDLLVPVSTRAGWWRRLWEGDVVDGRWIPTGPLRGQWLRFDCNGYRKEIGFLAYALRFLENGKRIDGALGSHAIVRLQSKTAGQVPLSGV